MKNSNVAAAKSARKANLLSLAVGLALAAFGVSPTLADPMLSSVTLGTQWPVTQVPSTIHPGDSATFPVVVARTGTGNIEAYPSISGLPAGATASFSPTTLKFNGNNTAPQTFTLSIAT